VDLQGVRRVGLDGYSKRLKNRAGGAERAPNKGWTASAQTSIAITNPLFIDDEVECSGNEYPSTAKPFNTDKTETDRERKTSRIFMLVSP
jgi:hypothetical protein